MTDYNCTDNFILNVKTVSDDCKFDSIKLYMIMYDTALELK